VRMVDTHEHLEEEATRLARPLDFSDLFRFYAGSDALSAGMPPADFDRFMDPGVDPQTKWRLLAPYWPRIRFTGYCRAIRRTIRDVYQIDDLSAESVGPLTAAMQAANRPGVHRELLTERSGLEVCLVHNLDGPGVVFREGSNPELYLQDLGVQHFLTRPLPLEALSRQNGLPTETLPELLRVIDHQYERWGNRAVAIKNNCAYWRSLRFDDVTRAQAETLFQRGYIDRTGLTSAEEKALQDFLFHHCIQRALDYRLPIKIHTGYLAGNNTLDPARIRATDLIPLFRKYPQARFDLFHIGYPYQHEVLALVKQFTNVAADLCWTWIIDPVASRLFVRQFLAVAPLNKLLGFGGDYGAADCVYGHSRIAREGLAAALTEMLHEGEITRAEAEEIGRRVLRENAMEYFRISEKRRAVQG
jgi:uncharacterized protein